MRESEIERYFVWTVERMGGRTFKFVSPNQRGVADRIACLPDGSTHFVELKTKGGRLSDLQRIFAREMARLNQNYACLWTTSQVDEWASNLDHTKTTPPTSSTSTTAPSS
jgi:hypothetical protein